MSSRNYNDLFRINLGLYYLIDDHGIYTKITPRPHILLDNSALVIISKIDKKVYDFTGNNASEAKREAAAQLAANFGTNYGFTVEEIIFPSEDIKDEHIQFIEYFIEEYYLPKIEYMALLNYHCYFCGEKLNRNSETCPSCDKRVMFCFICNLPLAFGEDIGKCSKCGEIAHLVHFQEWLKTVDMCPKCNEKLTIDGIDGLTMRNKGSFFDKK